MNLLPQQIPPVRFPGQHHQIIIRGVYPMWYRTAQSGVRVPNHDEKHILPGHEIFFKWNPIYKFSHCIQRHFRQWFYIFPQHLFLQSQNSDKITQTGQKHYIHLKSKCREINKYMLMAAGFLFFNSLPFVVIVSLKLKSTKEEHDKIYRTDTLNVDK